MHRYDTIAEDAYNHALEVFQEQKAKINNSEAAADDVNASDQPELKLNVFNIVKQNASNDPIFAKFWDVVNYVPEWVDWEQIERGQQVFLRYGAAALNGISLQSLLGGFGSAKTVETLSRTGGFSGSVIKRRLDETGQWNLQVVDNLESIKPGGAGWESTVRVRLLHTAVRNRISKLGQSRKTYYDSSHWGIPINDFDQAGTIGTLSAAPIWFGLPRQGIWMKENEIIDYIALWRWVAWIIGAPTEFFETPKRARLFMEATLAYEINPTETSALMAQALVSGIVNKPPMYSSANMIIAGARWMNGDKLIDQFGLYKPSPIYTGLVLLRMAIIASMVYSTRSIPYLDKKAREMLRQRLWKVLVYDKHALAGKKTDFGEKYVAGYSTSTKPTQTYTEKPPTDFTQLLRFILSCAGFALALYYVSHGTLPALKTVRLR